MGDPKLVEMPTPEQLAELERLHASYGNQWRDDAHFSGTRVGAPGSDVRGRNLALLVMLHALPSLLAATRRLGEVEVELGRRQAMCIRAGVCERCDGTGNGEPDYVDHVAIPTACESCCGGGSQAFFDGKDHERGYLASCIGTTKERVAESLLDFEPLKLATALTTANARIAELEADLSDVREMVKGDPSRPLHELVLDYVAKARADERAKVVAWLIHEAQMRAEHACTNLLSCPGCAEVRTLNDARVRLERGEHDDG